MNLKNLPLSRRALSCTALVLALHAGVASANEPLPHPAAETISSKVVMGQYHPIDPLEAETLRAGFGPLALALGITSVDLALMGMYWGVYVPYYATQEPAGNYAID